MGVIGIALTIGIATWLVSRCFVPGPSPRRVDCAVHLRQIGSALALYADEHDDKLPARLEDLVRAGFLNRDQIECPAATGGHLYGNSKSDYNSGGSYLYLKGSKVLSELRHDEVVVADKRGNHAGGGYALYKDGSVKYLHQQEFDALRPFQNASTAANGQ